MSIQSVGFSEKPHKKRTHGPMQRTLFLSKSVINGLDNNSLVLQESKTIIFLNIISWINAINSNRVIVLLHFPSYRGYMIDVIEVSDTKQVHHPNPYFTILY
jgi:hypothetical protein